MALAHFVRQIKGKNKQYVEVSAFRKVMNQYMKDAVAEITDLFEETVATWDHKVKFEFKTSYADEFVSYVAVSTSDDIYNYVNNGTAIRHAKMTPDFIAKTEPGSLQSDEGRGGLHYVRKSVELSGIEARKFDEQIMELYEPDFKRNGKNAIRRAVRRAVHA